MSRSNSLFTLGSVTVASVLAAAAGPAQAASYSYDFSGALSDQFTLAFSSPGQASSGQVNGQLVYSTLGQATADELSEGYVHKSFSPTFSESWVAEITATVPHALDSTKGTGLPADLDTYAEAGLGVWFTNSAGSRYELFALLGEEGNGRSYLGEYAVTPAGGAWTELRGSSGDRATTDESSLLGISFNAVTKELKVYNSHETLQSLILNTGDANWGIGANDHFTLVVGFDSEGWNVPASTPLSLDNFSAKTLPAVPEPQTYALLMAGLGVVVWAARRTQAVRINQRQEG